jgi:hypothetical protein
MCMTWRLVDPEDSQDLRPCTIRRTCTMSTLVVRWKRKRRQIECGVVLSCKRAVYCGVTYSVQLVDWVILKKISSFQTKHKSQFTSELRSFFEPSDRLASRRSSARLEPFLKKLVDWVSWHQRAWAPNAENEMSVSRIFKNLDFRNFNFQKFYVHNIHQI